MRPVVAAPASTPSPAVSPWHSPVPYLFGGLAAMMGLIAIALLILACSYWKQDSFPGAGNEPSSADGDGSKSPAVFADLVAVIMAGEKMPTFLAAPIARRAAPCTAAAGEGLTEDEADRGKEDGGAVAATVGERSQQLDQVV